MIPIKLTIVPHGNGWNLLAEQPSKNRLNLVQKSTLFLEHNKESLVDAVSTYLLEGISEDGGRIVEVKPD